MTISTVKFGMTNITIKRLNDKRIELGFGFNKKLLALVKSMEGPKWHGFDNPPKKVWSVADTWRTSWVMARLQGLNPYARYDQALIPHEIPDKYESKGVWQHQRDLFRHVLTRKQAIIAAQMGTGKTLVSIMVAHYLWRLGFLRTLGAFDEPEVWFVGPNAAVAAVNRELRKWDNKVPFRMFTFDALVKHVQTYDGKAPKYFIVDEASRVKTWTSQRTQAVRHVANAMRDEYGDDMYILLMSGTPAPKNPVDWWSLVEIACPGFLVENSPSNFKKTMCVVEERESIAGGKYPHLLGWLDDEKKCAVCCKTKAEHALDMFASETHAFVPSVNEVARLAKRLDGLVMVKLKKDCLDLPEHTRRIIRVKPTMNMMRRMQMIKESATRAPQKLMLMRELSDGFQYDEETKEPLWYDMPKLEFVDWFLDNYEEDGRVVVWANFTAVIDKLEEVIIEKGWRVLRIDGSGSKTKSDIKVPDLLDSMDFSNPRFADLKESVPKVCVLAHPKAGGMSYTFTGAPAAMYYGNDFNGEDKMQSLERIHRGGMDANRGCTTYEVVCLPTDMYAIELLERKANMQAVTMNDLDNYQMDLSKTELFANGEFK